MCSASRERALLVLRSRMVSVLSLLLADLTLVSLCVRQSEFAKATRYILAQMKKDWSSAVTNTVLCLTIPGMMNKLADGIEQEFADRYNV